MEQPIFLIDDDGRTDLEYVGPAPVTNLDGKIISLRKHEIILSFLRKEIVIRTNAKATCGYCILHYSNTCSGCPVKQETGRRWCIGSPYEAYESAKDAYFWGNRDDEDHVADLIREMTEAIEEEIEFLKSLPD